MKKILFVLLALAFAGCKKSLKEDPRGQVVGSQALSTVAGLNAALTGTYKPLATTWVSGFTTAAIDAVLMGSDDLTTHPASNKQDFREFDQYNVSSLNGRMVNIWNGCYKSIQGANNIINNYKTTSGDAATINQIVGEAYYLRALDYYWLIRLWGKIPLITSEVYDPSVLKVSGTGPAEVYKLIESDLINAEKLMADKKKDDGRASKGAASALLADVYLTEGGWPINDNSKYALAAAKAKEVIDNKASYGFDLVSNLNTLWQNTKAGTATAEEVFSIHNCGTCNWFNSNVVTGASAMPLEENGWDDYFTEIRFFIDFPAGIRKDVTFHTVITKADGTKIPWQSTFVKHPYYQKFRAPDDGNINSPSSTLHLMRFAHVLLIYAEAQARTGAPNEQAYSSINSIRSRAGLAPLSGLSSTDFINAVINERAWEFAGEYTRWFDITRLQILPAVIAKRDAAENPVIGTPKYYLPVPAGETQLDPNLSN
ncbi:RagB/SusD family nutrient uptake outer membrane protein [Mucilaginibacter sp. UC70_90]